MNEVIIAIITLAGSFLIARLSIQANQRKTDAEIAGIYERLGLDKAMMQAESANTWMDVAGKAVTAYKLAMEENAALKQRIKLLEDRIDVLEGNKE